jgi:oligosaccharyltransferase complex subunit epsilon
MPPKQRTSAPQTVPGTPYSAAKPKSSNDAQDILQGVWNRYVEKTPQRTKLLDSFMLFLVVVGALQFLYVVLVGNFVRAPFTRPVHLRVPLELERYCY